MKRVSVSDLLAFQECPRAWKAKRVEKMDDSSRWSRIGTACHVACEAVTAGLFEHPTTDPRTFSRAAVTAHADEVNLPPDEMHEALQIMETALDPQSQIRHIQFAPGPGWTAVSEQRVLLTPQFDATDDEEAAAYSARLDRLQWNQGLGIVEVWDWKTGQDWMSSDELQFDEQAQWYARAALAVFPAAHEIVFRRVMLRLGYVATAKFVRGEPWQASIEARMKRVRVSILKVRDGVLEATERVGSWCKWCPRMGACQSLLRRVEDGHVLYPTLPREERARLLYALKAVVSTLDEQLRADVQANGPIDIGDGTALNFQPQRSLTLRTDLETAKQRMRELGMNAGQEGEWFAPSPRSVPKIVERGLHALLTKKRAGPYEEELLAPATTFAFECRRKR